MSKDISEYIMSIYIYGLVTISEPKSVKNKLVEHGQILQKKVHNTKTFLWDFKHFPFNFRKVGSSNTSCLEEHSGFLRLLMKWDFKFLCTVTL